MRGAMPRANVRRRAHTMPDQIFDFVFECSFFVEAEQTHVSNTLTALFYSLNPDNGAKSAGAKHESYVCGGRDRHVRQQHRCDVLTLQEPRMESAWRYQAIAVWQVGKHTEVAAVWLRSGVRSNGLVSSRLPPALWQRSCRVKKPLLLLLY
jgi:hypothetical protein